MGFQKGNKLGRCNKGRVRTPEWTENQRKAKLGKHYSPKTEFKKGQPSSMSGKENPKARNNPQTFKRGMIPWNKGKRGVQVGQRGEKCWNWQGGKTKKRQQEINSLEYKEWRRLVYERDDYTCQSCGCRGTEIHADHVLPYSLYPEMKFDVLNGRTLCIGCHRNTKTWGLKINSNYAKQHFFEKVEERLQ